jgi:GNAT superfamily N-acetyltransferase
VVLMALTLQPVTSSRDLRRFVTFPWLIYRGDPFWVPPLIRDQLAKLDPAHNPFWSNAERMLWIAWEGRSPVGTVAAIVDRSLIQALGRPIGTFGFFECVNEQRVADLLLDTAAAWLAGRGMVAMRGPYNPSIVDGMGVLVEGHHTRPALLEAHTPPYYASLLENAGFTRHLDAMAWLARADPTVRELAEVMPKRLLRVAERVRARSDVSIRRLDMTNLEGEVALAGRLYNASLAHLPQYVPLSDAEFRYFAAAFRPILDPDLALLVSVAGEPAGFSLTLPDFNEALRHANGRLWPLGLAKIWWHSRRLTRATLKVLVMLPQYRGRGLEALLIVETARTLWAKGYRELDMSLTGEENQEVQRLLEGLGAQVYRRYRVYERTLSPPLQ